jgi:TrmH family RNA methyltransferase
MGALFRVPTGAFDDAPNPRIGLVARGGTELSRLALGERATFLLGAEREGLPEDVAHSCDELASIPLADGAESLNVAAAGAIALYEFRRRSI